jgi:hypothetical protein
MKNELKKYEDSFEMSHSLRWKVVKYIEQCHLEDGGYFFARVPPSNGLDTYFAVKSLSILGVKPDYPEAIADFFLTNLKEGTFGGMTGIFITVEVLNELGRLTNDIKNYAQTQIMALQNKAGGFGAYQNIDVEIPSELQNTYRAIRVLTTTGANLIGRRLTLHLQLPYDLTAVTDQKDIQLSLQLSMLPKYISSLE